MYLLVRPNPAFLFFPLNFYEGSRFVLPQSMDTADRHNRQRNKRTNGRTDEETRPSVRPSVSYMEFDTYNAMSRHTSLIYAYMRACALRSNNLTTYDNDYKKSVSLYNRIKF